MPVHYEFDGRIIRLVAVGDYPISAVRDAFLSALGDPACPADPVLLLDARASAALPSRQVSEIRELAAFLAGNRARFGERVALVAESDVGFGMLRMGEALADHHGVMARAFRSDAEARAWLLDVAPRRGP